MVKLTFLDGSFMWVSVDDLHYWEMDPNLARVEVIDRHGNPLEEAECQPC